MRPLRTTPAALAVLGNVCKYSTFVLLPAVALAALFFAPPALAEISAVPIDMNVSVWAKANGDYISGTNHASASAAWNDEFDAFSYCQSDSYIDFAGGSTGATYLAGGSFNLRRSTVLIENEGSGTFTIGVSDTIPSGTPLQLMFHVEGLGDALNTQASPYSSNPWWTMVIKRGNITLLDLSDFDWSRNGTDYIWDGGLSVVAGETLNITTHSILEFQEWWIFHIAFDTTVHMWAVTVPEPGTLVLLLTAGVGLLALRLKRRR